MVIKSFKIENFKSIKSVEIILDKDLNVLTGVNNSGKTTIIEALALWVECFNKLIRKARRGNGDHYKMGDYIFTGGPKYFEINELNSIHYPNFQDIFYNLDVKRVILLSATIKQEGIAEEQVVPFTIKNSTSTRYVIELKDEKKFDYKLFNSIFSYLPNAVSAYYSSPVANVVPKENFMTTPVVEENIVSKRSYEVMRNRLYKLYYTASFSNFAQDLSYILYNTISAVSLKLIPRSDVHTDPAVVMVYTMGDKDTVEKDIALLGSGTLQVMEILLNVYHQTDHKKDINLILLDEPDSHIHRDMQTRLYEILSRKSDGNQIVITTHNEALIRTTPLQHLFHIDGRGEGVVKCMRRDDLQKNKGFSITGIYPDAISPVISKLSGGKMGLDFISAIESDLIVFVEGEDDARLLYRLFYANISNYNKKIVFWVLEGVTKILQLLPAYRILFMDIRNQKTLWQKSCLVFDRDRLLDVDMEKMYKIVKQDNMLSCYSPSMYTQEAVLLTDLNKTAMLLIKAYGLDKNIDEVVGALSHAIQENQCALVKTMQDPDSETIKSYIGIYLSHMGLNEKQISERGISLNKELRDFYAGASPARMATKDDVAVIINKTLEKLGLSHMYDAENDFYRLVSVSETATQFDEWKQMTEYLTKMVNR